MSKGPCEGQSTKSWQPHHGSKRPLENTTFESDAMFRPPHCMVAQPPLCSTPNCSRHDCSSAEKNLKMKVNAAAQARCSDTRRLQCWTNGQSKIVDWSGLIPSQERHLGFHRALTKDTLVDSVRLNFSGGQNMSVSPCDKNVPSKLRVRCQDRHTFQ